MIGEITLALSIAERTFNAMKTAHSAQKDLSEMKDTLGKFFAARDVIAEAKHSKSHKTEKSIEEQAFDLALAKHRVKQFDRDLRQMFIYSDAGLETYNEMMLLRRQLKEQKLREERALAKRKNDTQDILIMVAAVGAAVLLTVFMVGFIIDVSRSQGFYL